MSTLKTTNLQNASAASPAFVLAADGSATANLSSLNGGPIAGSRNRIINGDMRIDQRNAGAAVTVDGSFPLDRFQVTNITDGSFSSSRSTVAPAAFTNSLYFTTTVADASLSATQRCHVKQSVEGFNVADLAWGTASAASVTISFWVRSSLTGTFGGAVQNVTPNRSYPFSYTITLANTWEQKSITIPGDTAGTWAADNTVGIAVIFGLGVGSTYSGTAGAWAAADYRSATGATSVVGTNGATFYITGVQLEPGTVATPFERRSYAAELALAQRYYQASGFMVNNSGGVYTNHFFKQSMRAVPTVTTSSSSPSAITIDGFYLSPVGSAIGSVAITASAEL